MIEPQKIKLIVSVGQLAVSLEKREVACDSLIQEVSRFKQIGFTVGAEARRKQESLGAAVESEGGDIGRRPLLDGGLLTRRKFGLELIRDRFCDLALNGEHVVEWTIVNLRPHMRVGAGIDQLRVHAHFAGGTLDTAFEQVRDAELLSNLAQIACNTAFVLHYRRAADDLQVCDLGQVGQDFILHAVGEKCILFMVAQVFERKHSNAFLRNGRSRGGGRGSSCRSYRRLVRKEPNCSAEKQQR